MTTTYTLTRSDDELLDEIVEPAVKALTHDGEIKNINISRPPNGDIIARLTTVAEPLSLLVWYRGSEETVVETRERVYSDLQDALAESSFAWGQLRE